MNWTCMKSLQYIFTKMLNAKNEMFFPSQLIADLSLYRIARPCSLFVYLQTLIVGHKPAAKSYFLAVNMAVVINIHNLFHQMPFANAYRERCPPCEWIQPWIAISRLSLRCWEKRPDWDILSLPSSVSLCSSCSHTHICLNSDTQDQYHPTESEISTPWMLI